MDQVIEAALAHGIMRPRAEAREARGRAVHASSSLPNPETIGERYPHQVSGGQLQRAMTAMALCPKPDLIVFDEPTTALDVTTQIDVLAAIKDAIRDTGVAALYITHDLAVVAQVADEIMVLRHGKMVECGTTRPDHQGAARRNTPTRWSRCARSRTTRRRRRPRSRSCR